MRSTITLLIGLSTLMLFVSIYGISYVNAQSAPNNASLDNKSINANSAVASEQIDPFTLRGSSNDASTSNNDKATDAVGESSTSSGHENDVSATDSGSSTSSGHENDVSATDSGSSTSSSNDDNKDSSTSSSNDNRDNNDHGCDDDKSSKGDKSSDSKDDKKFELPFP